MPGPPRRFLLGSAIAVVLAGAAAGRAEGQGSQWALRFHGTGLNQQDRVRIAIDDDGPGPDASAPCDVGAGSFTVELWLRGTLADNGTASAGGDVEMASNAWIDGNIVVDRDIWSGSAADWGISLAGGRVRFGTGGGQPATDGEHTLEGSDLVLDGAWHHVACVRDASTGRKRIYVDGVLDFESAAGVSTANLSYPDGGVPGQVTPWGPYIVLAAEKHDAGPAFPSFAGYLDEVRLWNVARTGTEILVSRHQVLPAGTAGLVASYRFEEGGGTAVLDSSGAGSPAGQLLAGVAGNGEWVGASTDPSNVAPVSSGPLPPGFARSTIVSGLEEPTALAFLPDGRILVGERDGTVHLVQGGQLLPQALLELPADTARGERGLVGIAVHPQFSANGWLYVFWTTLEPRDRVSRFTVTGSVASPASEAVIWESPDPAADFHHGGAIRFGSDGRLYVATGDRFDSATSQDLAVPYGKILRLADDGSVPADNPFVGIGGADPAVWARGLRNPFRFTVDAATGEIWIGDVGGNSSTSWEEVNLGQAGANYGWPHQEGSVCAIGDCAGFTQPRFSYRHDDPAFAAGLAQASITLGPVYRASAFPLEYRGNLFFGDYANRWIRRAVFDGSGAIVATPVFFAAPEAGTIVDLAEGPDGALWFLTLGVPWSGSADVGALHRISWSANGNQPPIVLASASPTQGPAPLTVSFSSVGTFDPDGGPAALSVLWTFGDGATSTQPNPVHAYASPGPQTATLAVNDGQDTVLSKPIAISVGNVPFPSIHAPAPGTTYRAGDTISFSGSARDADDGSLPSSALTWRVLLVHGSHVHPFVGPLSGIASGSFTVPVAGHPPEGTHYEVVLEAKDSSGLVAKASVALQPEISTLVFDTVPSGIAILLDGQPETTPRLVESVVGYQHAVTAPATGSLGGAPYAWQCWLGGAAATQTVVAPLGGANHTAIYAATGSVTASLAVAAANRNADWYPPVGQASANVYDAFGLCAGRDGGGVFQMGFEVAIPVPPGSTIVSARLELVATADQAGSPVFTVRAYDVANAPPFVPGSPTSLAAHAPLVAKAVPWNPLPFAPGATITSPQLASLVQAVVDRPDWAAGNFLGLVVDGSPTSGDQWRCVRNFASGDAPRLQVTWSAGGPAGCVPCGATSYGHGASPGNTLGLVAVGTPSLGSSVSIRTTNVTTEGAWTLLCEAAAFQPFLDGVLLVDLATYQLGGFGSALDGTTTMELAIPPTPSLAGYVARLQSLALEPSLPQGLAFSNGLVLTVCP